MKPDNIYLVRHGESEGNVDKTVYGRKPDYALELTSKGREQAREAGKRLREMIGDQPVHFYISPMWRTRQTYLGIIQSFDPAKVTKYEDPRLMEQEWDQTISTREHYEHTVEKVRDAYGHFYYRFVDGGESCADVFYRNSGIINTMHRDFEKPNFPRACVGVGHGLGWRTFLMRWYHSSVEEFESWANLKNCEILNMELQPSGKFKLLHEMRKHQIRHPWQFNWEKFSELAKA